VVVRRTGPVLRISIFFMVFPLMSDRWVFLLRSQRPPALTLMSLRGLAIGEQVRRGSQECSRNRP
jgi:xanthosine utilization system XapX-like protein